MSDDETTYGLVLPFDSDDDEFARGVELGIVWGTLSSIDPWESRDFHVHGANAEMMVRIGEATKRPIKTHDTDLEWMSVKFGAVDG